MKIKDVRYEVYFHEQPSAPRVHRADAPEPTGKKPFALMRIITDDGIEGFATEVFGYSNITEPTTSIIKREIVGRDPLDREWIWQRLWYLHGRGGAPVTLGALSAVDIALWDIAGKALGLPIYKLLGGYRDKIKIYASSYGKLTIQEYVDEAVSCKEQGIAAYKIHPYWGIGEKDIEICRAVRKAVGDDMKLMFDPAGRYNREEALRVGKELDKLNFYWFELPVQDHDIEGLVMLREKLDVPICSTETPLRGMYSIPEYLLRRACDIVRCDTRFHGGITPCKKIADTCNAFGMQCELHGWACNISNLHVECAAKNCEFHEMSWPEERYGLKEYPVIDDEGYIHAPQKPGLGIEIDFDSLGEPVASY